MQRLRTRKTSVTAALPVLYSFRRCPYAMRARLAVAASAQACELREVLLRDKPPELRVASPKATVPVLVLPDGQVLDQSLDIMLWALQRHDPGHWLVPQIGSLETMLALITRFDEGFKQHLDRYKYPGRYAGAVAENHRDAGAAYLAQLEEQLGADRHPLVGHLFGSQVSLADMAIAPFVRQFAQTDRSWFDAQPWPKLQAWLAAFIGSDSYAQTMQKFPPWVAGSPGVYFLKTEMLLNK